MAPEDYYKDDKEYPTDSGTHTVWRMVLVVEPLAMNINTLVLERVGKGAGLPFVISMSNNYLKI